MINADKVFASVVNEAKLSSKDRNKLNDSDFGLPKERKFPLNDESHVRSAITFFKYCPVNNRNELANNINKKLKEFDLHIEVGKDNPFYKLGDKKYITESAILIENVEFDSSADGLPIKVPTDNDELEILENSIYNRINDMCTPRPCNEEVYNRAKKLNDKMYNVYINYLSYSLYNGKINSSVLFYVVVKDFCDILNSSLCNDDMYTASKAADLLYNISTEVDCNYMYLYNNISTCIYCLDMYHLTDPKYDNLRNTLHGIKTGALRNIKNSTIFVVDDKNIMKWVLSSGIENRCGRVVDYYYNLSHKTIDSIFDIPSTTLTHTGDDDISIGNIFKTDKLKNISKYNLSTKLSHADIMRFNMSRFYIDNIQCSTDCYGDTLYVGCKDTNKYILLSDKDDNSRLFLLELNKATIDYFTTDIGYKEVLNLTKLMFKNRDIEFHKLTEGLSIDADGNIKVTIKPSKSYMDDYSQNHKLLVENWKNKNYEGVKKNIAFAFALINIIERDKRYKEREPEIVKARAFATNDFKTYLNKLTQVEKDFDFVSYYNDSDYDKLIIDIPKQSLVGIKMLVKALMK